MGHSFLLVFLADIRNNNRNRKATMRVGPVCILCWHSYAHIRAGVRLFHPSPISQSSSKRAS